MRLEVIIRENVSKNWPKVLEKELFFKLSDVIRYYEHLIGLKTVLLVSAVCMIKK